MIEASTATILTTNQYASGLYYETNIGTYVTEWLDKVYPDTSDEILEIRTPDGEPDDEQEPIQHETVTIEFALGCKKGTATAAYMRKVKADIYRMVGASIDAWRTAVDASLKPIRGSWEMDIQYDTEIFGELIVRIHLQYLYDEWLLEEPVYN